MPHPDGRGGRGEKGGEKGGGKEEEGRQMDKFYPSAAVAKYSSGLL